MECSAAELSVISIRPLASLQSTISSESQNTSYILLQLFTVAR